MSFEKCIQSLAEQQFNLRCEKVMRNIQKINHDEFSLRLIDEYGLFHFKLKNHFLHFLNVVSSVEDSKNDQISFSAIELPKNQKINVCDKIYIKSLIHFIEKLMENDGHKFKINLNNQDFISTLTFSLFPAISSYFHINLVPTLKKDINDFNIQFFNYNNVFLYLSDMIQKCDGNAEKKSFYQTIFDLLMRPMFASPLFINFCINFFQPLFSKLQDKEINTGFKDFSIPKYLLSQFDKYFDLYIHLIPPFILLNLKASDDPIRTLRKSFFEIAFKSAETSQFYGLFHYSKPPNPFILKTLHYAFMLSEDVINMVCVRFLSIADIVLQQMKEWKKKEMQGEINITTCSCSETKLSKATDDVNDHLSRVGLALDMKNYYFEENVLDDQAKVHFNKILLSSTDIELLNYIINEKKDTDKLFKFSPKAKNNTLFYVKFDKIDEFEDDIEFGSRISSTISDSPIEIAPNLRHLLQNSDPLPDFITIPSISIEEFFDQYLVARGPIQLLPKRKINKKAIFDLLPKQEKSQINKILEALPKTLLDQDKEIQKLTITSLINKKIDKILALSKVIGNLFKLIDNIILLKNKKSEIYFQNFKTNLNKNYIKNPKLFENDINYNQANLNRKIFAQPKIVLMFMIDKSEDKNAKKFSFGKSKIVYHPFFLDFISTYNASFDMDAKIKFLMTNSGEIIIEKSIESNFPLKNITSRSRLAKNKHIVEKVRLLPKIRKEIIIICTQSFTEYSILRKVELFNKCYRKLKAYIDQDLPDFIDGIGADEMAPLISLVIFITNPSYYVLNATLLKTYFSNFFENEFCSDVAIMLNSISTSLLELLRVINENSSLFPSQDQLINDINRFVNE